MMSFAEPIRKFVPAGMLRIAGWPRRAAAKANLPMAFELPPIPTDIEDILSEPPPRHLQKIHYVVTALFASLLLAASLVKVDIIIAARGRIVTDTPTAVVQPLQLSIIREIRVKVGDTVHKGDVLATLDPTFAQADQTKLSRQESTIQVQMRRLMAELNGTPFTAQSNSPEEQLQLTLYQQRQSQYASKLHSFDEDLERYQSAITTAQQNRVSLTKQVELAKEVEGMREKLLHDQWGSKLNYLDAQSTRLRAERDYEDATNHLTELEHTLRSSEAQRQIFIDEWRRQMLEELSRIRSDETSVAGNLIKADKMNDLVVLTAPEDGIVLDIAKRSIGSVLHEAEPLITLVPTDASLIAEVMIKSADVGYAKIGDDVAIKVDAFPYQRHGLLQGQLRSVAEDSVGSAGGGSLNAASNDQANGVFHRSEIVLDPSTLKLPQGAHLIPGMALTAEIKVGARSVISYFLYPIMRGFTESIREP